MGEEKQMAERKVRKRRDEGVEDVTDLRLKETLKRMGMKMWMGKMRRMERKKIK